MRRHQVLTIKDTLLPCSVSLLFREISLLLHCNFHFSLFTFNFSLPMQTLTFTPSADHFEATFTSGDTNTLQLKFSDQEQHVMLSVLSRIDSSMPWHLVKTLTQCPLSLLTTIDVPADLTVLITTNVQPEAAGVLIA